MAIVFADSCTRSAISKNDMKMKERAQNMTAKIKTTSCLSEGGSLPYNMRPIKKLLDTELASMCQNNMNDIIRWLASIA